MCVCDLLYDLVVRSVSLACVRVYVHVCVSVFVCGCLHVCECVSLLCCAAEQTPVRGYKDVLADERLKQQEVPH